MTKQAITDNNILRHLASQRTSRQDTLKGVVGLGPLNDRISEHGVKELSLTLNVRTA